MHQSRKEQGVERTARGLLQPDLREARIIAELDTDIEAAEEWSSNPMHTRRAANGAIQ